MVGGGGSRKLMGQKFNVLGYVIDAGYINDEYVPSSGRAKVRGTGVRPSTSARSLSQFGAAYLVAHMAARYLQRTTAACLAYAQTSRKRKEH